MLLQESVVCFLNSCLGISFLHFNSNPISLYSANICPEKNLHLYNSLIGISVVLSPFFLPSASFMYSGFIRSISLERWEESAFVDGSTMRNAANIPCLNQ